MKTTQLLAHFDRLADGLDAIPRLRRFILDLAVRGKLVPQDPNDEPAAELLKRIQGEKARLVKEGKIRKLESLPPIGDNAPPFPPLAGWSWAHLVTVSRRIHYGYTASANMNITDVRLLRITDIQNNSVDWSSVPGCDISAHDIEQYQIEKGDILIARTGGTIGKTYLVVATPVTAVFASYLIRIQVSTELDSHYLKLFMESSVYWKQLEDGSRGGGQPNVNSQTLGKMFVPLPPLVEQYRIVAKVDELMALCDRLEAAQAERESRRDRLVRASLHRLNQPADTGNAQDFREHARFALDHLPRLTTQPEHIRQLRRTILNLAVRGKLVEQNPKDESGSALLNRLRKAECANSNSRDEDSLEASNGYAVVDGFDELPNSWVWTPLGAISDISAGSTPSRDNLDFWHRGTIPWVASGATSESVILNATEYVTEEGARAHRLRMYSPGTLLVALYGQGKTRGQVATLGISATINQACAAICAFPGFEELLPYIKLVILENYDRVRLTSAGGPQPNLNGQKIKGIHVPLPPLAEQHRIVAKVDELMALCDRLESKLNTTQTESRRLLKAVLHEALTPSAV